MLNLNGTLAVRMSYVRACAARGKRQAASKTTSRTCNVGFMVSNHPFEFARTAADSERSERERDHPLTGTAAKFRRLRIGLSNPPIRIIVCFHQMYELCS